MRLADSYRDNAADCAFLAERSEDEETRLVFLRMEAAWRTLANQQELIEKKPPGKGGCFGR
jgi:hypothetical protein